MRLHDELSTRLRAAMRQRDRPVTAALRSALGDLANAEAVASPAPADPPTTSEHLAGTVSGVGAAEVERRTATESEARVIVERSRAELVDHAGRLARLCRLDEADGARRAAAALGEALDAVTPDAGPLFATPPVATPPFATPPFATD